MALGLNASFLLIEAAIGWWSGSLALLSDAAHMLGDVAALSLALVAAALAARPPTALRTFGLVRAEILGAFVNAVILVVAAVFIIREAVERLASGAPPIPGLAVLVVGGIGLAINLGSAWALWRADSKNLNVRGALLHMLADALGSVGAMVSAILVLVFGWHAADAVVSLLIAALVLAGAYGVLRDSTRVLLEFAPRQLDSEAIREALVAVPGVLEVHDLHVWTLTSEQASVTAHLVADPQVDHREILRASEAALRERFSVSHSTLQIDCESIGPCRQRNCTMLPEEPGEAAHVH